MYIITIEKSKIWNDRLKKLIRGNGYTQESFAGALQSFAEALYDKYDTKFTQRAISLWTRVGNKRCVNKEKKTIGFPTFENMLLIADFFGVDIGYLIGETDEETFTMEKACAFMGLGSEAIKTLIEITDPEKKNRYLIDAKKGTLDDFITADGFHSFIDRINDLHQTSLSPLQMDLERVKCIDYIIDFMRDLERQDKIERYMINEALVLLINKMYPVSSVKNLPEEYGECDFCHRVSHEEVQGDSGFICPIKQESPV